MPRLEAKSAEQREWLKGRNKYVSGFCNNINKPAQCEGTKPRSGPKPLPTCHLSYTCPCDCHFRVDQMFAMTGMERVLIPNPDYVPDKDEFVIPVVVEDPLGIAAVTPDDPMEPVGSSDVVPVAPVAVSAPLATRRTDTGRAARGGLEAQVWDACTTASDHWPVTPKEVSDWIAEKYKIATPSTGAVNAVWDRWEKLGFCTQAKKPNRFTGFTGDGTWEELARLKSKTKRETKQTVTRARQGYRTAGA